MVTAVILFFVQYLWLVPDTFYALRPFDSERGVGIDNVLTFFGGAMTCTVVLLGPLLMISRRWTLPFGAGTLVFGAAVALEALSFSRKLWPVAVAAIAGLAFDVTLALGRRLTSGPTSRGLAAHRLAAFTGPAVLFGGYLLVAAAADGPLGWPPEIWGGLVVSAGFVGVGLVLIQESGLDSAEPTSAGGGDLDDVTGADLAGVGAGQHLD
jgi:hypothetical protein